MRHDDTATTRRKIWYLETYTDDAGGEHVRRLPGVRFGKASFGRVRVMYRDVLGRIVWAKRRPYTLRARTTEIDNVD